LCWESLQKQSLIPNEKRIKKNGRSLSGYYGPPRPRSRLYLCAPADVSSASPFRVSSTAVPICHHMPALLPRKMLTRMMIFNVPGNIQDISLILYSRIADHWPRPYPFPHTTPILDIISIRELGPKFRYGWRSTSRVRGLLAFNGLQSTNSPTFLPVLMSTRPSSQILKKGIAAQVRVVRVRKGSFRGQPRSFIVSASLR
jgi:hypothetical protein